MKEKLKACRRCQGSMPAGKGTGVYCSPVCAEAAHVEQADRKRDADAARRTKLREERVTKLFTGLCEKGYVPSKSYENTLILKGPMVGYDCRKFPKKTVGLARQLGVWPQAVEAVSA